MDVEIKIGREASGAHAICVPSSYKRVSRRHATILWHDGIVTIEDNESSNGTYVNGRRIAKTKINEGDTVFLGRPGDEGAYQLDLINVFALFKKTENDQRTDYSYEFEDIKRAYMEYQQEVSDLKAEVTKQSQMPRLLATLIPAVIGLIILLISDDVTLRILSMSIGSVLSGIVGILTLGKSSATNDQLSEEITELQIKYQPRYCCPKCGMKYPFTTHWKKLEAEGKCPNPKCNATFVNR